MPGSQEGRQVLAQPRDDAGEPGGRVGAGPASVCLPWALRPQGGHPAPRLVLWALDTLSPPAHDGPGQPLFTMPPPPPNCADLLCKM